MFGRPTLPLLSLLLLAACAAPTEPGHKRQTLWDAVSGSDPAGPAQSGQAQGLPAPPPPRPHQRTAAQALIDRLRRADPQDDLAGVAAELTRRGPAAREALTEAIDREEQLLELLRDLREPPPAAPAAAHVAAAPWVEGKYRLARDRFLAGDHYGALRLIDAIFVVEPNTALTPKLRRLQRRARDEALRASVILAEIVPAQPVVTPDRRLEVVIALENRGDLPIVLRTDDATQPVGLLSVDFEELLPDGARTRVRSQLPVRLPQAELAVAPGARVTLPLVIPASHRDLRPGAVGRYRLGGRLRPTRLVVGGLGYGASLPLLPVQVLVVASEDASLAEAPDRSFAEALAEATAAPLAARRGPAQRAFVAALLWGAQAREAALTAVAEGLKEARGPLSDSLCAAMARLTGEPLSFSRGEWLAWWATQADRPGRPAPKDD